MRGNHYAVSCLLGRSFSDFAFTRRRHNASLTNRIKTFLYPFTRIYNPVNIHKLRTKKSGLILTTFHDKIAEIRENALSLLDFCSQRSAITVLTNNQYDNYES